MSNYAKEKEIVEFGEIKVSKGLISIQEYCTGGIYWIDIQDKGTGKGISISLEQHEIFKLKIAIERLLSKKDKNE